MNVTFDEFKKLDIRIGTVVACEKVEDADKLLKLEVDFGEFKRQIVSGIAEWYSPEDLVGKQCPFLVNLEPRTIRDVESQGMLLVVEAENKLVMLSPEEKMPEGSKIR